MKVIDEPLEDWPDKLAEAKKIATAADTAFNEGKPGIKVALVDVPEGSEHPGEEKIATAHTSLIAQLRKLGRYEVKRLGGTIASVRKSIAPARQRTNSKPAAAKKSAAPAAKK